MPVSNSDGAVVQADSGVVGGGGVAVVNSGLSAVTPLTPADVSDDDDDDDDGDDDADGTDHGQVDESILASSAHPLRPTIAPVWADGGRVFIPMNRLVMDAFSPVETIIFEQRHILTWDFFVDDFKLRCGLGFGLRRWRRAYSRTGFHSFR